MQPLSPPDTHFLSAAAGWYELGNITEAKAELERISPALREHPDVLELRWLVHAQEKNWEQGLEVAEKLVEIAPERSSGWLHRAYALRRVKRGGLQTAWDALLPTVEKFPKEPTIPYNLSCYACQMGRMDEARPRQPAILRRWRGGPRKLGAASPKAASARLRPGTAPH